MFKTTTPICAYCGKQFKELKIKGHDLSKLPDSSKLIIKSHVMQCPENPLVQELDMFRKIAEHYHANYPVAYAALTNSNLSTLAAKPQKGQDNA